MITSRNAASRFTSHLLPPLPSPIPTHPHTCIHDQCHSRARGFSDPFASLRPWRVPSPPCSNVFRRSRETALRAAGGPHTGQTSAITTSLVKSKGARTSGRTTQNPLRPAPAGSPLSPTSRQPAPAGSRPAPAGRVLSPHGLGSIGPKPPHLLPAQGNRSLPPHQLPAWQASQSLWLVKARPEGRYVPGLHEAGIRMLEPRGQK